MTRADGLTAWRVIGLRALLLLAVTSVSPGPASGQHEGHAQPSAPKRRAEKPSERVLFQSDMTLMAGMAPRDPMGEMSSPRWQWMTMGAGRLVYNRQGGDSGDDAIESTNWAMLMTHRSLGTGRVTIMLMSSLEPATVPERGSPQLFQTGEAFERLPLVDRQHPHDLIMHLSATYRAAFSPRSALWFQLAAAGEPALGPTAFMHRASSGENPTAPLGHHWQDSSHITYNVMTIGAGWDWFILESSVFHGEEPDEERWDLDGGHLDSFAARVKLALPGGWSAQLSHGYLHEPEALAESDTHRTTASLHYGADGGGPLAASLVWGRNNEDHGLSDSILGEFAFLLTADDHVYSRVEWVEKDGDLLATKDLALEPDSEAGDRVGIARIGALTLGYFRNLGSFALVPSLTTGLGGDLTLYRVPTALRSVYGESPVSVHVFLGWRWGAPHRGHAGH